jgi:hypothetical protein
MSVAQYTFCDIDIKITTPQPISNQIAAKVEPLMVPIF